LTDTSVSAGLNVLVEIGDSCLFGVIGSIVGIVVIVVVVENVL
jgi:hypothetical protein